MARPFSVGINRKVVGKCDRQNLSYAGAFKPARLTIEELADHISAGHPWMPAVLDNGSRRLQSASNYAEVIAADIDRGMAIAEAMQHPFIAAHCALAIESASSSPEQEKFRLIFALPQAIKGWETVRVCNRYLIHLLGVADKACKDASRFFFGAPGRKPFLLNPPATLPESFVADAIAWAAELDAAKEREIEESRKRYEAIKAQRLASGEADNTDELIQQALDCIPPRYSMAGAGSYEIFRDVLWALKNHYGEAQAIAMMEAHSPSAQSGWNISQVAKWRSQATLGTLFWRAREFGFKFPQREKKEWRQPDVEHERWLAEQAAAEEAEADTELFDTVASQLEQLGHLAGSQPERQPKRFEYWEAYTPGCIPEWAPGLAGLRYQYQASQGEQFTAEAIAKGWQNVVDSSHTGAGKSFRSGSLDPNNFAIATLEGEVITPSLYYLDANHRNPSTAPVERNFEDLPVRNRGFVVDHKRKTALGKPHLRHAKPDDGPEVERTAGNCENAHLFAKAAAMGFDFASDTASINPICQRCRFSGTCGQEGYSHPDGSGYRAQRAAVLKEAKKIRLHPDSAPNPENFDYSSVVGIWEEWGVLFKPAEQITINRSDFSGQWDQLESSLPDLHQRLTTLRTALRTLLSGENEPYHGWDNAAIMEALGTSPEWLNDETVQLITEAIAPSLDELLGEMDGVDTSPYTKAIASLKGKIKRRRAKLALLDNHIAELQKLIRKWENSSARSGGSGGGKQSANGIVEQAIEEYRGFRSGDRVTVSIDHFDKATQKNIISNNEAPVGRSGVVVSLSLRTNHFADISYEIATIEIDGTRHDVPASYLRFSDSDVSEAEGFRVGQRVIISVDHFDAATQREMKRNNEAPVGKAGVIIALRFVQDEYIGLDYYEATLQLTDGTRHDIPVSWLRATKPAKQQADRVAYFGPLSDSPEMVEARVRLLELQQQAGEVKGEIDSLTEQLEELESDRENLQYAAKVIKRGERREAREKLDDAVAQWLPRFLRVWAGIEQGALRVKFGKLTITTQSDRHRAIAQSTYANIWLDATGNVDVLAMYTGIPKDRFISCRQVKPETPNLKRIQIFGFGSASKTRADSTDERLKLAIAAIQAKYPGRIFAILDHKAKQEATGADGYHFVDTRGTNRFETADGLISIGLPKLNLGVSEDLWLAIAGEDSPSSADFYQWQVDAEIIQLDGRDRLYNRPEVELIHIYITDDSLPFDDVEQISIDELCPEAARGISPRMMVTSLLEMVKEGVKVTQGAIAKNLEISQGYVSRAFSEIGGWKLWKKILPSLIDTSIRVSNIFAETLKELTTEEQWIALEWLPQLVFEFFADPVETAKTLATTIKAYGLQRWRRIVSVTPTKTRAGLLAMILSFLPPLLRGNILERLLMVGQEEF